MSNVNINSCEYLRECFLKEHFHISFLKKYNKKLIHAFANRFPDSRTFHAVKSSFH